MANISLRTTTTFEAPDSLTVCGTTAPAMVYDNGSEMWLSYEGESDGHTWEIICTVCGLLLSASLYVDDKLCDTCSVELWDSDSRLEIAAWGDKLAQRIIEVME